MSVIREIGVKTRQMREWRLRIFQHQLQCVYHVFWVSSACDSI
jgi:hypothetical protein